MNIADEGGFYFAKNEITCEWVYYLNFLLAGSQQKRLLHFYRKDKVFYTTLPFTTRYNVFKKSKGADKISSAKKPLPKDSKFSVEEIYPNLIPPDRLS